MKYADLVSTLALAIATLAFFRNYWEWRRSCLRCSLDVAVKNGCVFAETAVENSSVCRRKILWAFLIVSPASVSFLKQLETSTGIELRTTNQLIDLQKLHPNGIAAGNTTLIPLPFYYKEQVGVRDERLTYSAAVNCQLGRGLYDVRFFVFPDTGRYGLHRCNHGAFQVPSSAAIPETAGISWR